MEPKFADIYSGDEPAMLQDAYDTITSLGLWDWLKEFNPHPNEGFMLSANMNLAILGSSLKHDHSGASFGLTMRIMQDIAKNGWEKHRQTMIDMGTPPCPCRRQRGIPAGWCGSAGGGVPACDH